MKLALIADLHANREAVAAVLAHAAAQGVDRHAFLGDYVGYGADPGWVVDQVREHVAAGAIAVRGNQRRRGRCRDRSRAWSPMPAPSSPGRASRLDAEQLAFLAALPLSRVEDDMLFVHANAWAPAEWDYCRAAATRCTACRRPTAASRSAATSTCRCSYHLASTGKAGDFTPDARSRRSRCSAHRRWLVIPGSAGQPRDGDPAACYAMFDDRAQHGCTFHRVPYDRARPRRPKVAAPPGLPARRPGPERLDACGLRARRRHRRPRVELGRGRRRLSPRAAAAPAAAWRHCGASAASSRGQRADAATAADHEGAAHAAAARIRRRSSASRSSR